MYFLWWPNSNIYLFKSFWAGRNTFIIKDITCLVLKTVFDSYFIAKPWRSVCTYAYSVAIGTKGHKLSLLWLCYPNQYWWYRIDARTSMKTRFSSMKRLDDPVNYNLSHSKSIFVISDLKMDWFLVYLVFWCEFPHTVPISNKQTNIKGMMFQILTYKSATNTDIGKLLRLIKHRIHYNFHLQFPNALRICLFSMVAGFDKFISMNSGCEGILLL